MNFAWVILAVLGMLWLVKGAASEMFQEEVKTRLEHLPNTAIRLAAMRLPKEVRDDIAAEWRGELASVLHDTDGLPLTRLLRGLQYAVGLFSAASGIVRDLADEERIEAEWDSARNLLPDLVITSRSLVGYRGATACAAAGITYRQLDYWARAGLIEPSIGSSTESSSSRLYSARDIVMLKVVKRLLDTGISLMQLSAATSHLSSRDIEGLSRVTLMSDGRSVYECVSPDEVVDLLCGGQGVFGIALGRVCEEVGNELSELPSVNVITGKIQKIPPRDPPEDS